MKKETQVFEYEEYDSIDELSALDKELLERARQITKTAYAPYSHFHVGAAARLTNGKVITGTNQENASFPAGLCAERVLLSSASSVYPDQAIETMAISYDSTFIKSDHPVAPCGVCRQSLVEFEERMRQPIRLILGGMAGQIFVINNAAHLLPFAFRSDELR